MRLKMRNAFLFFRLIRRCCNSVRSRNRTG